MQANASLTRPATVVTPLVSGLVLFAGFFWLGSYVSAHPEPPALWAFAQSIRGHAIGLAWFLTNLGFAKVLAPLYVLCLFFAVFNRAWRLPAVFTVGVALIPWIAGDRFQHLFHRPRRDDWLIQHVHAFSYPSTHASISVSFYFLWGVLLFQSHLSNVVRYGALILLTALTLGIMWSRLALGAHYPTDVIGGACLGLSFNLLGTAVVRFAGGRLADR